MAIRFAAYRNALIFLFLLCSNVSAQEALNEGSNIDDVRIFAGFTVSKNGVAVTPSVVTLIRKGDLLDCRFVAFVGEPLEFRDTVIVPKDGSNPTFRATTRIQRVGETDDPRGFMVEWIATLDGNVIQGRFSQPYDRGSFTLHEAYEDIH
jgi:hypothetical protein